MKKLIILFLIAVSFLGAVDKLPVTGLLGKTYIEVIKTKGFPNAIFPVRQSIPEKDDVVFVYEDSYFYFYSNHLYRIFFSSKFSDEILPGLKIGDDKSALTKLFGQKYTLETDGLIWTSDKYLVVAKMDEKNKIKNIWFITKLEK